MPRLGYATTWTPLAHLGDHDRTMLALPEASGLVIDGEHVEVLGPEPAWLLTETSVREHPTGTRLAIAAL